MMDNGRVIVGVDIGGTNIRVGTVDSNINLKDEKIFSSRQLQGEKAVENLVESLKSYIDSLQLPVEAVSIGFPSTINKNRDVLINTPNLSGFTGVQIKKICEDALKTSIFINRDAAMLLYYDLYKLGIKNDSVIVGVYIGTGIGNSIIVDGVEITGHDGVACELGHIPVPGRDMLCSCGLKGCIELYAGGKGLERICAEAFPETAIGDIFVKHCNTPQIEQFISDVADVIVIEITILNPGCVVLGGGVLQMEAFPKELLRQTILKKTRRPVPGDAVKILFSESETQFSGVIGAALYAMNQLEKARKE